MAKEAYVLIVDDDPMVVSMLTDRLDVAGYSVTSAYDAWQEVVQAQGLRIGLIISDIMMPGAETGVDAYKKLRSTPGISPALPIIFLTGLTPEKAKAMIPPDPKVRLLHKPVDFEKLRAAIKELTGLDRPLAPQP